MPSVSAESASDASTVTKEAVWETPAEHRVEDMMKMMGENGAQYWLIKEI